VDHLDDREAERTELYRLFASLFMQEPAMETILTMKEMFRMECDDTPDEVAEDFRHLFLAPQGELPSYESLYNYPLKERPGLWGRVTEEVQNSYRAAGLVIDAEIGLAPDHLSAELLFMSYLIEHGLSGHQKDFLETHILTWVPEYCDEIRKRAHTTFYREVADLLKEFVTSDYEEFGHE